jgi:hypothetical protein
MKDPIVKYTLLTPVCEDCEYDDDDVQMPSVVFFYTLVCNRNS